MRKILATILCLTSISAQADELQNMYGLGVLEPASGDAESEHYISAMVQRGSLNTVDVTNNSGTKLGTAEFDTGRGASLSYGSEFMDPLIWEFELQYSENEVDSAPANTIEGDVKSYSGMLNLLIDMDFLPVISPYVGGGAGFAHVKDARSSDTRFAYQGIGGLSFDIFDDIELVTQYKYLRADGVEFEKSGTKSKFDYIDQGVEIGIKIGL